jgi:hypothetical protein
MTRFGIALVCVILLALGQVNGAEKGGVKAPARPPRPHYRLGKAPKAEFKVRNRRIKVDPAAPAVKVIRSLPSRAFSPDVRKVQVERHYRTVYGVRYVERTRLAPVYVGPFRSDFVYWTYDWPVTARAYWAWNNRTYVDAALWAKWMEDSAFAQQIDVYVKESRPVTPGYVPERYATLPPAVIYNDEYIDAVYNPEVDTTPSIVVGGAKKAHVADLEAGAARFYGNAPALIDHIGENLEGLQFIAIADGSNAAYQIQVNRDGELYVFGPKRTPAAEAFGGDAAKWERVEGLVVGGGIDVVYRRNVIAGEKIRLHGFEWSVASESIELMKAASPAAILAAKDAETTINVMFRRPIQGGRAGVVNGTPDLRPQLEIARDAAHDMVTESGSVDQAKVNLFHASLAKAFEVVTEAAGRNTNQRANDPFHDVIQRIATLERSVAAVEELRSSGPRTTD